MRLKRHKTARLGAIVVAPLTALCFFGPRGSGRADDAKATPTAAAAPEAKPTTAAAALETKPTTTAAAAPEAKPTTAAAAVAVEDTPLPPKPEREAWRVGVENARVTFRAPRTLLFTLLPNDREIPDGSQILVRIPIGSKGRVRVVHKGGRLLEITTTTVMRLSASELTPETRPFRIAIEDLPSNLASEEIDKVDASSLDRLVAFFVPRVALASADEPSRLSKKPWLQNPIRPTSPGPVHLVEAEGVPAVVNFEWPVQGGQEEPHAFYLWMENRFVQAPQSLVRGGRVSVSLSSFGKYYWQVEDRTGQYVSAPRVVYLRRPGENLEDGTVAPPTPVPSPTPTPEEGENEGTFQLKNPRKRSHITVCLAEGRVTSLPVVVPNAVPEAARYIVETNPPLDGGKLVFEREDDRPTFEASVRATRLGNVVFSVRAELEDGRTVKGDDTPVRIIDVCAKGSGEGEEGFQSYLRRQSSEKIPETGALYVLPQGESQ